MPYPALAGQKNVTPGGIYKGTYVSSTGMEYKTRIKVYDSGKSGNFSLQCAGIQREKIQIQKGKTKIEFGADEVQVKGRAAWKGGRHGQGRDHEGRDPRIHVQRARRLHRHPRRRLSKRSTSE